MKKGKKKVSSSRKKAVAKKASSKTLKFASSEPAVPEGRVSQQGINATSHALVAGDEVSPSDKKPVKGFLLMRDRKEDDNPSFKLIAAHTIPKDHVGTFYAEVSVPVVSAREGSDEGGPRKSSTLAASGVASRIGGADALRRVGL